MQILVLDADASAGAALADIVRRHLPEAHVDTALSFRAGLDHLAMAAYDAVLTDPTLPDAPGIAALSNLTAHYPDTPVILLAAQCGRDVLAGATLSGVYHVLPKPVEAPVLMAMLNRVIQRGGSEGTLSSWR